MGYDLAAMARQAGNRRNITLRPIQPTQANATELARIIAPAWRIWSENSARIMAGYDPVPIGDGMTLDTADQIGAAINDAAREFLAALTVQITPALRQWAVRVERWHRTKWAAAIQAGTGLDLSTMMTATGIVETLDAFVQRNVALVQNVSDQAQGRISDAVLRGYQQRLPAREVAKEISNAVGLGRARAVRIASDQNAKLAAALDMERQAEAGLEQYRWRHSQKAHPRQEHVARDGKLFPLGTPQGDTPGQLPYCGCRAQAYLRIMDEIE